MKFPVSFPLINREITSVAALQNDFTHVSPLFAQPGTITAYFDAVVKNANASAQNLLLRMSVNNDLSSDSTEATLSIPGSTTSYTRLRTSSFTLSSSAVFKAIEPASTDISVLAARIYCIVDTGSLPLYRIAPPYNIGSYEVYDYSDTSLHQALYPKLSYLSFANFDPDPIRGSYQFGVAAEDDMNQPSVKMYYDDNAAHASPSQSGTHTVTVETPYCYADGLLSVYDASYYGIYVQQASSMRGGTIWTALFSPSCIAGKAASGAILQLTGSNQRRIEGGGGILAARGQSFTVGGSGIDLAAIAFLLHPTGDPTDNLICYIYDGLNGSLVTNGTSNTLAAQSMRVRDWYVFTFTTPPSLSASTKYWARVERTGAGDSSNHMNTNVSTSNPYSGGNAITKSSGSWGDDSGEDCAFIVIPTADDGIEKFETCQELINFNKTGTSLQNYIIDYDPNDFDGVDVVAKHAIYASSGSSNVKLQYDLGGTPTDITNSSVTGQDYIKGSAMTMPTVDDIDANIVTA
jgi:hypothetical protein